MISENPDDKSEWGTYMQHPRVNVPEDAPPRFVIKVANSTGQLICNREAEFQWIELGYWDGRGSGVFRSHLWTRVIGATDTNGRSVIRSATKANGPTDDHIEIAIGLETEPLWGVAFIYFYPFRNGGEFLIMLRDFLPYKEATYGPLPWRIGFDVDVTIPHHIWLPPRSERKESTSVHMPPDLFSGL